LTVNEKKLGYKSPSEFKVFGLKKASIGSQGSDMPLKNGNIDYGYEYLGIHSIQETDPMATTIGGG